MRIHSMLPIIQGEGVNSGVAMFLVRTVGCPLQCSFCDSQYSMTGGYDITIDDLIDRIQQQRLKWVCLSGGEPLVWEKEIGELFLNPKWELTHPTEVETSGYMPVPEWWTKVSTWVVDWKCPSSGEESKEIKQWIKKLRSRAYHSLNAIKFVVSDEKDLKFVAKHSPSGVIVIVSPAIKTIRQGNFGQLVIPPEQVEWNQRVWNFCLENSFRFSLQLHKLVWGSERIDV